MGGRRRLILRAPNAESVIVAEVTANYLTTLGRSAVAGRIFTGESEDGTREALSIAQLGESTETPGCVTVIATVVSVEGNEIQFLGWPTTVSLNVNDEDQQGDENEEENADIDITLEANQVVLAVICISDDGQLIIVQITILDNDDENNDNGSGNGEKVLICHKPDKKGGHTLSVASPAVPAHLGHGDKLGACP